MSNKRKIPYTAQEKAAVLAKPILMSKDLQVLYDCGSANAAKLNKEFRAWFQEEYNQEIDCIPTEEFIKFSGYPEKRILRYAKLGF